VTPEVRELLAALRDCINLPIAIYDDTDKRERELNTRVNMLGGAIGAALESSVGLRALTETARDFADRPLGYRPYQRPEVPA
jgi:hypothetical protein